MEELGLNVLQRLLFVLTQAGVDIEDIKGKFILILNDYNIMPKSEALTVYTEGKNEVLTKNFLAAKMVAGRSKKTIKMYKDCLQRVFWETEKDADMLTHQDIQIILAKKLQSGCSKGYCNDIRRVLSTFYNWAVKEGITTTNPVNMVEQIKEPKEKKSAFSDIELEKIRGACRTNRERCIIEMLLSTGCRVGELSKIRIDEINDNKIKVIGKGDKQRYVYLNAKAEYALVKYLAERKDDNPYLFPMMNPDARFQNACKKVSSRPEWYKSQNFVSKDEPCGNGTIEVIVRNIGKRAGVDGVHPHRFRRTCATSALHRGMSLPMVSKMLGHENVGTTQIYLDLRDDDLESDHRKYVV